MDGTTVVRVGVLTIGAGRVLHRCGQAHRAACSRLVP
jgi:hypothetical protein